ncbi:cytochrome C [bacterium BRH_c32]|nr:MAG: cytochrome C [bacterium BRH_c32]
MKMKLPPSTQNWISLAGALIALSTFFMILFLVIISILMETGNAYLGIIIYMILPAILFFGLLLIPLGMYLKIKKEKRELKTSEKGYPIINLNEKAQRNALSIFVISSAIFVLASAVGSYEAFHYTESVEFCGTVCHTVMKPEYTAYQNSAHARVSCVECHVGEGAGWYAKSKLSGLYQVYAVTAGVYPTPIPTPIKNLRPARETCEQCHWPQKFYERKIKSSKYYLTDDTNSEWDLILSIKIGPSLSAHGLSEGIHWHINSDVKIEYKALDEKREKIPWVRYTNIKTGEVKVFEDSIEPIDKKVLDGLEIRTVDCMDCHNRPSHDYKDPRAFMNQAISAGLIPTDLPRIKSVALDLLNDNYSSTDEAMKSISDGLTKYYKLYYKEVYESKQNEIKRAVKNIQAEFNKNIFPEMKVKWNEYPNNIGHLIFNGCFRCHNDTHITKQKEAISKNCDLCHSINLQGKPENLQLAGITKSLEFVHPGEDVTDEWKTMLCTECHSKL